MIEFGSFLRDKKIRVKFGLDLRLKIFYKTKKFRIELSLELKLGFFFRVVGPTNFWASTSIKELFPTYA